MDKARFNVDLSQVLKNALCEFAHEHLRRPVTQEIGCQSAGPDEKDSNIQATPSCRKCILMHLTISLQSTWAFFLLQSHTGRQCCEVQHLSMCIYDRLFYRKLELRFWSPVGTNHSRFIKQSNLGDNESTRPCNVKQVTNMSS